LYVLLLLSELNDQTRLWLTQQSVVASKLRKSSRQLLCTSNASIPLRKKYLSWFSIFNTFCKWASISQWRLLAVICS